MYFFLFLLIDLTGVQTPLRFCSSKKAPNLSGEELARLSQIGLGVPSFIKMDENDTLEHNEMTSKIDVDVPSSTETKENQTLEHKITSQTNPAASSSMEYDLNKTVEENEDILRRTRR